jgi:hypothetical protein
MAVPGPLCAASRQRPVEIAFDRVPPMLEPRLALGVNVLGKECVIGARHSFILEAAVGFPLPAAKTVNIEFR